jgi:hypothetical protein
MKITIKYIETECLWYIMELNLALYAQWELYVPSSLAINNSTFCIVFMFCVILRTVIIY